MIPDLLTAAWKARTVAAGQRSWHPGGRVPRRFYVDRALLALAVLVAVSTTVRFGLSRGVAAPWIASDEQLYGLLGKSLVAGDGLRVLGASVPYYSLLYPLLVGLPLSLIHGPEGVTAVQALQALLMSATAIPVYLWARPVAGSRWALLAAGLTVLIPGLAYSGLLMSETLYYLAATVAVWALAACLHSPTLLRQVLLLGAVGIAVGTRLQAIGLVAVIFLALALFAVAERSATHVRRMLPTFGILAFATVAWAGSRLAFGSFGALIGAYAPLAEVGRYSISGLARGISWQLGALGLITVGIPLVALGVLTWGALTGRESDTRVRALVATAVAYTAVTVVEVGAFASRFVEHITERQLLSVAPPLFVAFAVWLHRGIPRPQPVTSIVALAVAASTLLLPLDRVAVPSAAADAFSTIPLEELRRHIAQGTFAAVYAGVAAAVIALAVLLPRRGAPALAALVAMALAGGSVLASREIRKRSQREREITFAGEQRDWIDSSGARNVSLLVTHDVLWPSVWEQLFWNSSITRVARLPDAVNPGVVPQEIVRLQNDGSLSTHSGTDIASPYVAAPSGITIDGDLVATLPPSSVQQGMAVWRVHAPVRVLQRVSGLQPNGDLYGPGDAVIRVFECGQGRLELTLLGKQGLPTRVLVGGKLAAERAVPNGQIWRPVIASPPAADGSKVCIYTLQSDGLIGSTRIEFVRD